MANKYDFDIVECGDVIHFTGDDPVDIEFEGRVTNIIEDGSLTRIVVKNNNHEIIEIEVKDDWLGADYYDVELVDWVGNTGAAP